MDTLQVNCEGRKIGFHFDQSRINPEDVVGKSVTIEIGMVGMVGGQSKNVYDLNGNSLETADAVITISKTFANLKLNEASTRFIVEVDGKCDVDNETLRTTIASKIGKPDDASRIYIDGTDCIGTKLVATVIILPKSKGRRMLGSVANDDDGQQSIDLFYKFRDAAAATDTSEEGRSLVGTAGSGKIKNGQDWSFILRQMEVLPCESDLKKFKNTDPDLIAEEKELRRLASATNIADNSDLPAVASEIYAIQDKIEAGVREYETEIEELKETMKEMHEKDMKEMEEMIREMYTRKDASSKNEEWVLLSQVSIIIVAFLGISAALFVSRKQRFEGR
mmetsp:Transcript_14707/g.21596  ORF Transcript_14707/g.21596 Transcript_14707/m.21596 type:complete len:335 (+) Transcript_14707:51-1055(+)